ncbi:hypothetical protein OG252_26610 [Streptomyces sp. NBC_01352]|uniref:Secreted protein n=1 Tax=Streptomyces plumbiresistens TaxID=511811 RepID=A0ABP7QVR7_9ACTN|nr:MULTISPECIES: hypothetical protein [unclassified Streptomyces]MCX4699593.1 hypothetical protein [Streptomyces sp. NBC_01373]
MSTAAPPALGPARRRAWPRVLVLLLALFVPGAHAGAPAVPALAVAAEGGSAVFEYDVLDTVLRPVTRGSGRPVAPLRPAPFPDPVPAAAAARLLPVPPCTPPALRALRSVVLRC